MLEQINGNFIFLQSLFVLYDIIVANHTDDNTQYCTALKISNILIISENPAETLLQWLKGHRVNGNPNKYNLPLNDNKESFQIKIGTEIVTNSECEKLPGVKIDHELNFNKYVTSLCKRLTRN